ncbi:kinesin-like protein KIN-12C isoform X1 [Selaginella moellendorffii]|uniref:kinesin-like protein KIN-12C isoform X1 n=1 Tax=Selaginella moellendorffii TaxID=88036 RepID=UPI000D1CA4BD|nr:kinesin-like protein KIN-12C isoform X1 [Selaginella moellendorffii]|eukprot:XP_024519762.1 kinesin-like protein KIN-12C isoform X1 [Selaginella moellendorffii]
MPRLSPLRIFGSLPGGSKGGQCAESAENESAGRVPFGEISGFDSSTPCNRAHTASNPLSEKEKNVASDGVADRRAFNPTLKLQWIQQQAIVKKQQLQPRDDDARSDASEQQQQQPFGTPSSRGPRHQAYSSVQAASKHGGGSQFSTPRACKIDNKYVTMHSEPGSNSGHAGTGTPKKSVSRTLKYNQDAGLRAAGAVPGPVVKSLGFCQGQHGEVLAPAHFELEEDVSFWQDHNVQVLIRIRPPSPLEVSLQGPGRCLRQDTAHSLTWIGHPESRFTFDHVACESVNQEKLFRVAGLPMVDNCISGYNNCMFAYGQTGSGKTHTMLGDIDQEQSEGRGMIPRVFEYLFVKIQLEGEARRSQGLEFACKCSFLEIYNEQVSDLLEPSATNLQLREDVKKGVYVENLKEVEVNSVGDVMKLLNQGSANRRVAATNMNRESSRSHSVFTCVVESKWESDDSVINTRFGRLNLVDLAGSERQKSSGAEGDRLKEAANINKSLSTLGLVIMVLVDAANGKPRHIPYRDSKLTFLLQDSLGGNSKTMIIATVSPSNSCSLETLSTLKFAQRAKFIRNNAIINEDSYGDVVSLRQQIQQLKDEVNYLRSQDCRNNDQPVEPCLLHSLGQEVLAASLRREAAAESVIKNLGVEISHLKRLVRQREEDTQRVKMLLRFREDKIRRLEAAEDGSTAGGSFCLEDREALVEEVKVLGSRVEHNPEVTRFAMENIRLMEELKRFHEFYDNGERETMTTELSNLRDQLMEVLEANAILKEECGIQSHSRLLEEVENFRSEANVMEEHKQKSESLQRENGELIRELQSRTSEIEFYKRELDAYKERKACDIESNARLELQLKEAMREKQALEASLEEANELREQMESQQLVLINELEAAPLKQQKYGSDDSTPVLRSQVQLLQLELRRKEEIRCLEKTVGFDEAEKSKTEQEVLKIREELDEAQELNRLFFREKIHRLAIEKQMDVRRAEVEAETADTISNLHRDLLMANDKFALSSNHEKLSSDEVESLQLENARLANYCNELRLGKEQELCKLWQQTTRRLADYLSEGDATLDAAATEMERIFQTSLPDCPPSHFAAEKQKVIQALQLKLHQAFEFVKDAEQKMEALTDATSNMSKMQETQREEVLTTRITAEEAICRADCLEGNMRKLNKFLEVAFIVINNLAEAQEQQRELERTEDAGLICSLRRSLLLSEKRGHAALLVVKHCVGVEEQLRSKICDGASIISEQQTAIAILQEKNDTHIRVLEQTRTELQEHSTRLHEAEELWCAEKERLLTDVKVLTSQTDYLAKDCSYSSSTLLKQMVSFEQQVHDSKLLVDDAFRSISHEGLSTLHALKIDISEARNFVNALREDSDANVLKGYKEVAATRLALEKARATHASDMSKANLELDMLRESAEVEKVRLQMAIANAQEKLSSLQFKVGEQSLELQKAQHKCEAYEKDCMVAVSEMHELDIKVQELDDHIARLEAENGALKGRVASLLEDIEGKNAACKGLELSIQELVEEARKKQDDTLQLRQEMHSKADNILRLETVVRNVHEELSRSNSEVAATTKELQSLKDATLAEKSTWKSSIQELEYKMVDLNLIKSELEEKNNVLEQQVAVLERNSRASHSDYESKISNEIEKKESIIKGLEFDMGLLQESFADMAETKADVLETNAKLQHELSLRLNDLSEAQGLLASARGELSEKSSSLRCLEGEADTLRDLKATLASENNALVKKIEELVFEKNNVQDELEEKSHLVESLDLELLELSSLVEQKVAEAVSSVQEELNAVLQERDRLSADLLVVTEQLDMAQSLADEREIVAVEARKVAEASKAHAEEKDEEIKVLERSVGELESIVNALENQVGIVKREAQMQRLMREDLETEVQSLRHEITLRTGMIAAKKTDEEAILKLKEEIAKLSEDCFEKESQIQAYNKHISDLTTASTRQASHYQQKINELETFLDQAKATKTKGSSSPFKCIGKGLSQQMNSEFDEELSAARHRISELETIAAGRQREVYMLNSRLAEAESMTHDVVRDLLGVKMDITNYASLLVEDRFPDSSNHESVQLLQKQPEEYIEERDSCLDEIDHRQNEVAAIRVAAEQLRVREQALNSENEKLKGELDAFKKHQSGLENEVRKLSGQQNLQQRIHHHAKIKEENNLLKAKNDELSTKLRNMEIRLSRVHEELDQHRNANGKPRYEVEQQLRSKLKEAEDDNLQMAEELSNMCKKIMQVSGAYHTEGHVDTSVAWQSLEMLHHQLADNQKQVADLKLIIADYRRVVDR